MTKYKCGCESDGIIFATNKFIDILTYDDWSKSDGVFGTRKLCLYCWLRKNKLHYGGHCGYKKGKWVNNKLKIKG